MYGLPPYGTPGAYPLFVYQSLLYSDPSDDFKFFASPTDYVAKKAYADSHGTALESMPVTASRDVYTVLPVGNGLLQDPTVSVSGANGWTQYCGYRISFDGVNWGEWRSWQYGQYDFELDPYYDNPTWWTSGGLTTLFSMQLLTLPEGSGLKSIYFQGYGADAVNTGSAAPPTGWNGLIDPARVSDIIWEAHILLLEDAPSLSFDINDGATTSLSPYIKLTVDTHTANNLDNTVRIAFSNDNIHWGAPNPYNNNPDAYYIFYTQDSVSLTVGPGLTKTYYWDCTLAYYDISLGNVRLPGTTRTVYIKVTDRGGNVTFAQKTIELVYPSICVDNSEGILSVFPSQEIAEGKLNDYLNSQDISLLYSPNYLTTSTVALVLPIAFGVMQVGASVELSNQPQPNYPAAYRLSLDDGISWGSWQPVILTDWWQYQNVYCIVYPFSLVGETDGPINIRCNFAARRDGLQQPIDSPVDVGIVSDLYFTARAENGLVPVLAIAKPTFTVQLNSREDTDTIVSLRVSAQYSVSTDPDAYVMMSNNGIKWGTPWGGYDGKNILDPATRLDAQLQVQSIEEVTYERYTPNAQPWRRQSGELLGDYRDFLYWDLRDGYSSIVSSKIIYLKIVSPSGIESNVWFQAITYELPPITPIVVSTKYGMPPENLKVWNSKRALSTATFLVGKSGKTFIRAGNLTMAQHRDSRSGIWASSLTIGVKNQIYQRACVLAARAGIPQQVSGSSSVEIRINQLTASTIISRLTSAEPQYYTAGLLQRLGISEETLQGAIMSILGGYINKTLAALSSIQVNRNDNFAITEILTSQSPGENPILVPADTPPVASVQGIYSRLTSSSIVAKVSGNAVSQYMWSLDGGEESTPTPVNSYLELENLTEGNHTLHVRGGTITGIWQLIPTVVTFTVDLTKPITFDPSGVPQGFIGMHADMGTGNSLVRKIALSVDPYEVTDYSLDMQLSSGTFSYSGLLSTVPEAKSVVQLQGINGTVQRVGPSANRSKPGYSVEGRLLPLFTSEFVYLHYPDRFKSVPYYILDILEEVEAQTGATVNFTATNNRLGSFEFSGRFTEALSQLADLACGELIQQNGRWFIVPKGTMLGSFTVPIEDIISVSQVDQVDLFDQIHGLFQTRRDIIVDLERLKLTLQNTTNTGLAKLYRPLTRLKFSFGKKGKDNFSPIPSQLLIENSQGLWETWIGTEAENSNYFFTKPSGSPGEMLGLKGTSLGSTNNRYLFGVDLLYKVNLPADSSGLYRAKGSLTNLTTPFWNGDSDTWDVLTGEVRSNTISTHGGATSEIVKELYFKCSTMFQSNPKWSDTMFWECDLDIEYLPNSNAARSSDTNRKNALTDKLACIDKEITRLGFGSLISELNMANLAWSQYYIREGQKALVTELDMLNAAAVTADRAVVTKLVSLNPQAKLINISLLYNGVMPLPANAIMLSNTIPNSGLVTDCGRAEQVSFNGYQVSITARKI